MSRDQLQRAFVLHRRDYANSSLLLEVFSADQGRLPLIARGAKGAARGRVAQAALLQPFQPLWLTWTGRGEVRTLTRAEAAGRALPLIGDALYCGLYVNELLLRLLGRQDAHESLFVAYQQALAELGEHGQLGRVLRRFELTLLSELGWQPDLCQDAGGAAIEDNRYYVYDPEQGLRPAISPQAGAAISGETLRRLAADAPLGDIQAREARTLLRAMLTPHLGERPLKSRELFRRRAGR